MGKYSRCVIGIGDNDMQYLELNKQHSIVDEDIIMHKLPKDGAAKDARIKAILTVEKGNSKKSS